MLQCTFGSCNLLPYLTEGLGFYPSHSSLVAVQEFRRGGVVLVGLDVNRVQIDLDWEGGRTPRLRHTTSFSVRVVITAHITRNELCWRIDGLFD